MRTSDSIASGPDVCIQTLIVFLPIREHVKGNIKWENKIEVVFMTLQNVKKLAVRPAQLHCYVSVNLPYPVALEDLVSVV